MLVARIHLPLNGKAITPINPNFAFCTLHLLVPFQSNVTLAFLREEGGPLAVEGARVQINVTLAFP